jgi:UDP-glucose 4-epimerase
MTRFLKQNPTPVLLGFDPLMQVIHENDVVEALAYSTFNDIHGVYNIAAEGILPLSKILGLVGRFPLPVFHRFAYCEIGLNNALKNKPEHHFPIEPDYLRYPWITDITRMREEMGFTPTYTADELLREFAGILRLRKFTPESPDLAYDEERLRDTLERRHRIKVMQGSATNEPAGGEND